MDPVIGMIFYFMLAVVVSFTCSVLEAALLSTPVSFIKMKIDSGSNAAKKFLKLKEEKLDDSISSILTLNTFAHTIGAAGVGSEGVKVFGDSSFGIISGVMTVAILILSELIPKSIGAHYWKNMTSITPRVVSWMIFITYPLVWISRYVMKIFTPGTEDEETVTREEVSSMVSICVEEEVFNKRESKMIQNIIALGKFKVSDIMTPRIVCSTISGDSKIDDYPFSNKYSRIPVYSGDDIDNIIGIVHKEDILLEYSKDSPDKLLIQEVPMITEFIRVPESESVPSLFDKFLETKQHMAIVVGEYGTFEGVVTMEDAVETILGVEICDETDKIEDLQEYARRKWEEKKNKVL